MGSLLFLSGCNTLEGDDRSLYDYTLTVKDAGTQKPLEGVDVTVAFNDRSEKSLTTDSDGVVEFNTNSNQNKLTLEHENYIRLDTIHTVAAPDSTQTVIYQIVTFHLVNENDSLGTFSGNPIIVADTALIRQLIKDSLDALRNDLDSTGTGF